MAQTFSKIAKLFLWVILPTLFISGTEVNHSSLLVDRANDYTLQISGNLNEKLSGGIDFETSMVTTSKGVSYSTLKLKLDNKKRFSPHSMEFLISKKTSEVFTKGTYKVSSNQEGLLNYFDGVFGFANINALGELPLFAKSGEIQIDYLDGTKVEGKIRIQMGNAIGKSVRIKGNFIATK